MLKLWVLQLRRSAFVENDLGRRKIMVIYFSLENNKGNLDSIA